MITTSPQPSSPRARRKVSSPWDDVKVSLYNGSLDNRGVIIDLSEARRIVRTGCHEIFVKHLGKRLDLDEYTALIRGKRREWIKQGYDEKQVKTQFDELKRVLPGVTFSGCFSMTRKADLVTEHSGMIVADIDQLAHELIDEKWRSLAVHSVCCRRRVAI